MKTADSYAIRTLKAEELIKHVKTGDKDGFTDGKNWYPKFEIDLSDESTKASVIKTEENFLVNALFYQLAIVIKEKLEKSYDEFKSLISYMKLSEDGLNTQQNTEIHKYFLAENAEAYYNEHKKEIIEELVSHSDFLKYYIFFVDCNKVFRYSKGIADKVFESNSKTGRLQTVAKNKFESAPSVKKFGYLFETGEFTSADNNVSGSFEEGLYISFNDDDMHLFQMFDKSNSMARNSKISCIRKDVKKELEDRLLLGYREEFDKISVIQSKFYAYRGLYLTNSYRIDPEEDFRAPEEASAEEADTGAKWELNEKTVVIIRDNTHFVKIKNANGNIKKIKIYGDKDNDRVKNCKENNKEIKWEFSSYGIEKQKNNPFDGEGLICPEYAAIINDALKSIKNSPYKEDSTSFQIRMPFTKGMLHEVDFLGFLNEYVPEDKNGQTEFWIKDIYGIPRKLNDAKIILTDNLFKCEKWLGELVGSGNTDAGYHGSSETGYSCDPVKKYFEIFKKYNHAMYIANTDALLIRHNKTAETVLNYQFLGTLKLDEESTQKLIDKHFLKAMSVKKSIRKAYRSDAITKYIEQNEISSDSGINQDECDFSGEELNTAKENPALVAYAYDEAFYNDVQVRTQIKGIMNAHVKNIGLARILSGGECRFLSGDLLAFMKHIIFNLEDSHKDEETGEVKNVPAIPELKNKAKKWFEIYADRFVMPGANISLHPDHYYALLRSPHLSRNEQCILKPYLFNKENVYYKYFGHLKGIIMISRNALVADTLSGADYDGDLVKIYSDNIIVDAIKKGCYEEDKNRKNAWVRKADMPIVVIPNVKTSDDAKTQSVNINFRTIFNTFSNQIGHISNLAIKSGKKEYSDNPDKEYSHMSAKLTAITGLEIDSAKTGIKPQANIEEIEEKLANISSDFVDFKDHLKKFKPYEYFIEEKPKDSNIFKVGNQRGKQSKDFDFSDSEGYVLETLAKHLYAKKEKVSEIKMPTAKERFEVYSKVLGAEWHNIERNKYETEELEAICERLNIENNIEHNDNYEANLTEIINKRLDETPYTYNWVNIKKNKDTQFAKVQALMDAYHFAVRYSNELEKLKNLLSDAKYHNCVFPYLKMQYNAPDGNLSVKFKDEKTVKDVLDEAYKYLIGKFAENNEPEDSSLSNAAKALNRFLESNWAYTKAEDRDKKLYWIITGTECKNDDEINRDVFDLLTNFDLRGYKILYYVLKDILCSTIEKSEYSDEITEKLKIKERKNGKSSDESAQNVYKYYEECKKDFIAIYTQNSLNNQKWHNELNEQCKEKLWKIFDSESEPKDKETIKKALAFVFFNHSHDASENFLLNILGKYYNSFYLTK